MPSIVLNDIKSNFCLNNLFINQVIEVLRNLDEKIN